MTRSERKPTPSGDGKIRGKPNRSLLFSPRSTVRVSSQVSVVENTDRVPAHRQVLTAEAITEWYSMEYVFTWQGTSTRKDPKTITKSYD